MNILVVEDNNSMRLGIQEILEMEGHRVACAHRAEEALLMLKDFNPELVVTDLKMEGMSGIEFTQRLLQEVPDTPVLMITAFGNIEKAVEAMKKGVFDFIAKPFPPNLLRLKVRQIEKHLINRLLVNLKEYIEHSSSFCKLNTSETLGKQFFEDHLEKVEDINHIMISGPPGVEYGAAALRVAKELDDSETSFRVLDFEKIDAKDILSALKSKVVDELGSGDLMILNIHFCDPADFSVLLSQVQAELKKKKFRVIYTCIETHKAFSYWNRVVIQSKRNVRLPALKDRKKEMRAILSEVLTIQGGHNKLILPSHWVACFNAYDWPCNLLELSNIISRVIFLSENGKIDIDMLPRSIIESNLPKSSQTMAEGALIDLEQAVVDLEKRYIKEALEKAESNPSKAANLLGIPPHVLYYKMEKYDFK